MTSQSPTRAVIFDFDGVIVLSEPVHGRAWIDLAEQYALELPGGFIESGIGHSDERLSHALSRAWGLEGRGLELLAAKRGHYQRRAPSETELIGGVLNLLESLRGQVPVALATSSSRGDIEPVLARHSMHDFFDAILTIESVENAKPHPEIYLKAAARLGIDPASCRVFEDSIQGANAARAAGTRVIGMTTTLSAEELHPVETTFDDYGNLGHVLAALGLSHPGPRGG